MFLKLSQFSMHNVFMKSSLLHVRMVFITNHGPNGTSNCWYPPTFPKEELSINFWGRIKVCELTTLHFIMINTKLMVVSNHFIPMDERNLVLMGKFHIHCSLHLYLLHFVPYHNLTKGFPTFSFMCCIFVV
jgi:hypothetical protein